VQLFSLFDANPQLIDLMVDIASAPPGAGAASVAQFGRVRCGDRRQFLRAMAGHGGAMRRN
jgi:hypothetical protein